MALFGWFALLTLPLAWMCLQFIDDNLRAVAGPALAVTGLAIFYLVVLTRRDHELPIFEAGTFFVLATQLYTVVPLIQFAITGFRSVPGGDYRLALWNPTAREFGGFAWRHVLLLSSFVGTYLLLRGSRLWPIRTYTRPPAHSTVISVVVILILNAYFYLISIYVGPTLSVYEGGTASAYVQLPHFIQQITNILVMVRLTLKQCVVMTLLTMWHRRAWRWGLIAWLLLEFGLMLVALEGRTGFVVLMLTFVVGYHLRVRRIRFWPAFSIGAIALSGFLIYGFIRDLGPQRWTVDWRQALATPNEFQVLYGNAYDIYMRKVAGDLPEPPRQLYFSDFYRLIPSQLLPFYKWDPSTWYRDKVLDLADSGMGFMFGIVAQSVLGSFEWAELAARGILLGVFFAAAHRAWRRYSGSFWATVAYLFILTWAYCSFRATSFDFLYRIVYYLLPTAILVKVLALLIAVPIRLRRVGRSGNR
jgi:hypothetical protein